MRVITLEEVEKYWDAFSKYKETAEQHEFAELLFWDFKLVPLYNDLKKNWDEKHADVFLTTLDVVFDHFGITI